MIRSTIFWTHLICGVAVGLVVLMMSVTGVILTYERQMLAWAERATFPAPAAGAQRLTLEELVAAAKLRRPEFTPATIMLRNEPDAPVVLGAGRNSSLVADPYSGEVREPERKGCEPFSAPSRAGTAGSTPPAIAVPQRARSRAPATSPSCS